MKLFIAALFFSIGFALSPSDSQAGLSAQSSKESLAAFKAVDALVRKTRMLGKLPRWKDPDHAKVLARFWNVQTTLGKSPYPGSDTPELLKLTERANAVLKTYVFFTPTPGKSPDTIANSTIFQNEIARAGAYLLHSFDAQIESITEFALNLPAEQMNEARRNGIKQMRNGSIQMVTGFTTMLAAPAFRSDNRIVMLKALASSSSSLVQPLLISQRTPIIGALKNTLPSLSAEERKLAEEVLSAFENKECSGICTIK